MGWLSSLFGGGKDPSADSDDQAPVTPDVSAPEEVVQEPAEAEAEPAPEEPSSEEQVA